MPAAVCFSVVFARLRDKGWLLAAARCDCDGYLSHRHRAAQVVDQVVYQTSIRREWMDPVLCMCQSILVQDAESQFAPDIHRRVCV